jgi:hypothetical protein
MMRRITDNSPRRSDKTAPALLHSTPEGGGSLRLRPPSTGIVWQRSAASGDPARARRYVPGPEKQDALQAAPPWRRFPEEPNRDTAKGSSFRCSPHASEQRPEWKNLGTTRQEPCHHSPQTP